MVIIIQEYVKYTQSSETIIKINTATTSYLAYAFIIYLHILAGCIDRYSGILIH